MGSFYTVQFPSGPQVAHPPLGIMTMGLVLLNVSYMNLHGVLDINIYFKVFHSCLGLLFSAWGMYI